MKELELSERRRDQVEAGENRSRAEEALKAIEESDELCIMKKLGY